MPDANAYAVTPDDTPETAVDKFAMRESGNRNVLNDTGPGGTPESTASGYWQITDPTWHDIAPSAGIDLNKYPRAIDAPYDVQRMGALALYSARGEDPWKTSAPGYRAARMSMADGDTTTPSFDPSVFNVPAVSYSQDDLKNAMGLLGLGQQQKDTTEPSFIARLGEGIGGGGGNLTGAAREQAGARALTSFGVGLLASSGYHPVRQTMGEALAAGIQGAQASESGSQQMAFEQQAAQRQAVGQALDVLNKQQQFGIQKGQLGIQQQEAALKLQQMQLQIARLKALQGIAGGGAAAPAPPPAAPSAPSVPAPPAPPSAPAVAAPTPPAAAAGAPAAVPPSDVLPSGAPIPASAPAVAPPAAAPAATAAAPPPLDVTRLHAMGGPGVSGAVAPGPEQPVKVAGPGAGAAAVPPPAPPVPAPAAVTPPPPAKGPTTTATGIPHSFDEWNATLPPIQMPDSIKAQIAAADTLTPSQQQTIAQEKQAASLADDGGKAMAAALNHQAELLQQNHTAAQAAATAFQKDALAQRAQTYQTLLANDNAVHIEEVKAGITSRQKQADTDMAEGTDQLKKFDTAATSAGEGNTIMTMIGANLGNLPQGLMAQLVNDHPDMINWMRTTGFLPEGQATSAQLLNGLSAFMATRLRQTGSGQLRNLEMAKFQQALPNMLQNADGQKKALAFLMNMNDRIIGEADYAHEQFRRPVPDPQNPGQTMPAYNIPTNFYKGMEAQPVLDENGNRVGGGLGPVLPHYSGPMPANANDTAAYDQWVQQNVKPGRPYYGLRWDAKNNRPAEVLDVAPGRLGQ